MLLCCVIDMMVSITWTNLVTHLHCAEEMQEELREQLLGMLQDMVDVAGSDEPVPPIVFTSAPLNQPPTGVDELRELLRGYEVQLYGYLLALEESLRAYLERMSADLEEHLAQQQRDQEAARAEFVPDPQLREQAQRLFRAPVERACRDFLGSLVERLDGFLEHFGTELRTRVAQEPATVQGFLAGMPWQTAAAISRKHGVHRLTVPPHTYIDAVSDMAMRISRAPMQANWDRLFRELTEQGGQFEGAMLAAVNEGLSQLSRAPYFASLRPEGRTHLEPIRSLRDEVHGRNLAFHQEVYPTSISEALRDFPETILGAVRYANDQFDLFQSPGGTGSAALRPGYVRATLERHQDDVCLCEWHVARRMSVYCKPVKCALL